MSSTEKLYKNYLQIKIFWNVFKIAVLSNVFIGEYKKANVMFIKKALIAFFLIKKLNWFILNYSN